MARWEGNGNVLLAIERSGVVVVSALWIYVLSLDLVCASLLSFHLTDVMLRREQDQTGLVWVGCSASDVVSLLGGAGGAARLKEQ